MDRNSKRQLSPQAGTSGKKAKGPFNPREEAAIPNKNPRFCKDQGKASSDSDSEERDKAYLEGVKANEVNIDFELALDEDNIKEALKMATTDEQRERANKAAAYIEQVGRKNILGKQMQLSKKHMHSLLCLQVKRTRKSVTDPKNKPKLNFWATPRSKAAATAAQAYSSQVSEIIRLATANPVLVLSIYTKY